MTLLDALLLSPFDNGGPFDKRYGQVIVPACEKAGYRVRRADKDPKSAHPIETISQLIEEADVCICEITGCNVNVMMEIGYAFAVGTDLILIMRRQGKVPFNLQHLRVIHYDTTCPQDFDDLRHEIAKSLTALTEKRTARSVKVEYERKVIAVLGSSVSPMTWYEISEALGEGGKQKKQSEDALQNLLAQGLVESSPAFDWEGSKLPCYGLTKRGLARCPRRRDDARKPADLEVMPPPSSRRTRVRTIKGPAVIRPFGKLAR